MEGNSGNGAVEDLLSKLLQKGNELYPRVASNEAVMEHYEYAKALYDEALAEDDTENMARHLDAMQRYQPFINKPQARTEQIIRTLTNNTHRCLTYFVAYHALADTLNSSPGSMNIQSLKACTAQRLQCYKFIRDIRIVVEEFLECNGIPFRYQTMTPLIQDTVALLESM